MNIAILEDHRLFAETLKSFLEIKEGIKSVNLFFEIEKFENSDCNFDLTILDLDINNKSSLYLVKKYHNLKFLIISANNNPKLMKQAYNDGVFGYLSKRIGCKKLFNCIERIIYNEEKIFDNDIIMNVYKEKVLDKQDLTQREKEIAELLFNENTESYIANYLCISKNTVKSHKRNIFKKLGIKSSSELKYNYLFK